MIPIFNICSAEDCRIRITDRTQEDEQYIPESITDQLSLEGYYYNNKFKYSQTYTVNIIQHTTTKDSEIVATLFTQHCVYLDEVYYKLNKDGYYTIYHIILPSVEWLQEQIDIDSSILTKNLVIYVTDGNKIYKYSNGQLEEQDSLVIATINTEGTTISRSDGDTFAIGHLFKCYIKVCKAIFSDLDFRCLKHPNTEDLTFKRDFLWMTINVIKYYTDFGQLLEAQRLLEEVNYCNGLCNDTSYITKGIRNCGCGG